MITQNRIFIGTILAAILLLGSLVILSGRGQSNKQSLTKPNAKLAKQIDDEATPVVDLQNPDTSDRVDKDNRRIKNARHDNEGDDKTRPTIFNVNGAVGEPERRAGYSDIPVATSDLIVEAVVSESHAFLSNDKTGIYSEFTLLISKPAKLNRGLGLNLNDRFVGERFGGKIKYPSSQIARWRIAEEGIPIIGKRYLFFLAKVDQD